MRFYKSVCHHALYIMSAWPLLFLALFTGCNKKQQATSEVIPKEETQTAAALAAAPVHTSMKLFDGGNESIYHSFRIPSYRTVIDLL